jgi:hypothetical protein
MGRTMMDDVNVACESMSLAELNELYTKVGRLIDKKRADRKIELLGNLTQAYRELRKEFPGERVYVDVDYGYGIEEVIKVDIYDLMDKYFGEG